ncbi:class I SAM-dependent methyltransferase [Paenibacillus lycopersici]|uniref:Class I SAM-dependent methyltransferase n=1 Tax=Paenibacillus lycopersici TaxID=2704462 RepID=A0A6C0G5T8_9BACL|nr:class I SAM-dependent methyltransferase [Paenibacillus lycopersici]QHT62560.1 class I SAM-dependent methyltransferase [Paenibacillus lycopersici]
MNEVAAYYDRIDEDSRFSKNSRKIEFLTTKHILDKLIPQHAKLLDVGAGTGVYSLHYAERQHEVVAVDITPKHIELLKEKSLQQGLDVEAYVDNATDLNRFGSDTFDCVLCLGPMYHLTDQGDRHRCIDECLRVLKRGGYLAVAYINKYSILPMLATREKSYIRNSVIDKVLDEGVIFARDEDCFWTEAYFTSPDEIEAFLGQYDVTPVEHAGTDGISHTISKFVDQLDEHEFQAWMSYHLRTCRERSILGMSSHGLYICRKN